MKLNAVIFRNGEQFCRILLMKILEEKRDFAITFFPKLYLRTFSKDSFPKTKHTKNYKNCECKLKAALKEKMILQNFVMNVLIEQKDFSSTFSENIFQKNCPKRFIFVKMISKKPKKCC